MKKLFLFLAAFLCGCAGMHAQSFTVTVTPEHQTIAANDKATCELKINPIDGFSASANITVVSPSIWIPDYYYPHVINEPYAPARFDVPTPYSGLGTNMVIVEARNGPVVVRDTCYIEIVPGVRSAGWTYLTPSNSDNPDYTIYRFAVDRNNVGWIATSKGVARYDKTHWSFVSSPWPNARPTYIEVDSYNRVVISQDKAVARYDGSSWEVISVPDEFLDSYGIVSLATQGDTIWLGTTTKGINRYNGTGWANLNSSNAGLPYNHVRALSVDDTGRLWASMGATVGRFDGKFWTFRETAEYGFPGGSTVPELQRGPDGAIWALGRSRAVAVGGPEHPPIQYVDVFGEDGNTTMASMTFDPQGRPWLAPSHYNPIEGSVALYHFDNGNWYPFSMENSGISDNVVYHAVFDGSGTLWVSTHSSGLALFNGSGSSGVTGDREKSGNRILLSTMPNPMKDHGFALLRIPSHMHVMAALHDLLGRELDRFVDRDLEPGDHLIPLDPSKIPSGAYIFRVTAGTTSETHWIVK